MQILCFALALVIGPLTSATASATSARDAADGPSDSAVCERTMSVERTIASFVDYGQLIRDHGIDLALHVTDISPTLARGRFLIVPLGPSEQLVIAMGAREFWQDLNDFGLFVTVTNQGHLARTASELDRASGGRVARVIASGRGVALDKVVEDERLRLAYYHLRPNLRQLREFDDLVRDLSALAH